MVVARCQLQAEVGAEESRARFRDAPEVLKEVILQSAVYCGVPAANSAFALLSEMVAADQGDAPQLTL